MGVLEHHTSHIFPNLSKDTNFANYPLIVDIYSKLPKLYGMENITTEEVMEKLDMFQARFGKVNVFLMVYGDNSNQLWNLVYPQGVSGRFFCTYIMTFIRSTRP